MLNDRDEKDKAFAGSGAAEETGSGRMEDLAVDDSDEWQINIDQLLEQADMLVNNDMLPPVPGFEESASEDKSLENAEPDSDEASARPSDNDMDLELDEINSLLLQADLNEKVDEDMLALLESATDSQEEEENPDEIFDIFAEGDMSMDDRRSAPEQNVEEEAPEEKKSKKKKKRKKEKVKKSASGKEKAEAGEEEKKSGKPGLLAKLKEILTQKDDLDGKEADTAADENVKLINELNEAEEKKASKSGRKNKKKDAGKGKKSAKAEKPKKAKAAKPKKAAPGKKENTRMEPEEKPVKILNGKSFVAILGLCLSIIAAVLIVTTFLPEYANKKDVRDAYRNRDYSTVYRLLYDKKLTGSEELLFNQSKTILQLERRLKSYQNNITLGRELQAVDALLMGVESYQDLPEADAYNVRNEVDALYQQICNILESNYGISQEEALILNGYDEIAYTKALYALIGGTGVDFSGGEKPVAGGASAGEDSSREESAPEDLQGEEDADSESDEMPVEDMLPEEEDILN